MLELCDSAIKNNVQVLIDAEETWIQDAIDNLAIELMEKYNKKSTVISLTHQCYRTGTLDKIEPLRKCKYEPVFGKKFIW